MELLLKDESRRPVSGSPLPRRMRTLIPEMILRAQAQSCSGRLPVYPMDLQKYLAEKKLPLIRRLTPVIAPESAYPVSIHQGHALQHFCRRQAPAAHSCHGRC